MLKLIEYFGGLVSPTCLDSNRSKIDQMLDYISCQDTNIIGDLLKKLISNFILNTQNILVDQFHRRTKPSN